MTPSLLFLLPEASAAGMSLLPDPVLTGIQLLPFLLTLAALNFLIFKPMIAYLEARDAATRGARDAAQALHKQADEKQAEYDAQLAAVKAEIAGYYAQRRTEANAERDAVLAQAKAENEATKAAAMTELSAHSELAAKELQQLTGALGQDIAGKVLGRPAA